MRCRYDRRRITAVTAAVAVMIGMTVTAAAAEVAPRWEKIELERVPGATASEALFINDRGVIVGTAHNSIPQGWGVRWDRTGRAVMIEAGIARVTGLNDKGDVSVGGGRAARWDASGQLTELPVLGGAGNADTVGITADGTVVGTSTAWYTGQRRAVRWGPDGRVVDLGTLPGGNNSSATKVNDRGVVIGTSDTANGETHAVRWDRRGRITDLGLATAVAVNDRGEVVGEVYDGVHRQPVRWNARGRLTVCELPANSDGTALGINDHGTVVGATTTSEVRFALRWDRAGRMTVLETPAESWFPRAEAVNDRGEVIGSTSHRWWITATYWGRDGSVIDLGASAASAAADINRHSDIVGSAWYEAFGVSQATLWRVIRNGDHR
jgi:probable HAF family extracellular repeat protein